MVNGSSGSLSVPATFGLPTAITHSALRKCNTKWSSNSTDDSVVAQADDRMLFFRVLLNTRQGQGIEDVVAVDQYQTIHSYMFKHM